MDVSKQSLFNRSFGLVGNRNTSISDKAKAKVQQRLASELAESRKAPGQSILDPQSPPRPRIAHDDRAARTIFQIAVSQRH